MALKKILIIGFVWPEPNSSAAGSRIMQLINFFKTQGYSIFFATSCTKNDNAFKLDTIGVTPVAIKLNHSSFDTFVTELNPDIVLFDRFMTEEQYGWRVAKHCPNAIRILDTEDLHCLRKGRHQAFKAQKPFERSYLLNDIAKREIASIYRSDLSLIISEAEMQLLKTEFKIEASLLFYLPFMLDNITDSNTTKLPNFEQRKHFITIGNFLHEPNYDAILFLKTSIWPKIKQQLPQAEMHIYGAYTSKKVQQLHSKKDNFLIKGFATSAHQVMQNAKVCLAPLRFGAGLKGKLVDAMKNGTPCITTSIGTEAMYGQLPPNAFIEDYPDAFAKKAVILYTNKDLWKEKQLNGFTIVNQRFNKLKHEHNFATTLTALYTNYQTNRKANFIGQMLQHHSLQSTKFMSKWIEEKNKIKQQ